MHSSNQQRLVPKLYVITLKFCIPQPAYFNPKRNTSKSLKLFITFLPHFMQLFSANTKGQIISECLSDFLNFPKKTTEKFEKFLPKNMKGVEIIKIKTMLWAI